MTLEAIEPIIEASKPSILQRIFAAIFSILNSLTIRLVLTVIVSMLISSYATDLLYPKIIEGLAHQLVIKLANKDEEQPPTGPEILQTINQYNLAWYYITTPTGKVLPVTKPYAPVLTKYGIVPKELDWKNKHYFEAIETLNSGNFLHIGIFAGKHVFPNLTSGKIALIVPVTLGYLLLFTIGVFLLLSISLELWVTKPLNRLSRACYSLLLSRDAYSHLTGGGLKVDGAVTEVQAVSNGLKDIRRQYDQAVAARAAKEEELKRTRSEYQEEKSTISQQHQQQLAVSEARLTELHTKEAEEEFINSLGRELDSLKSSQQLYYRILEKLNDKYPTSIIFGAFFKISKTMECTIASWLGFDELSIKALKAVDHSLIARTVFGNGQTLVIGMQMMRDYGLHKLAQSNSVRNIVYMPVKFQNRNLGMLAFYFVQEGQTVQERLRVLRNVVELTGRALYQIVMYEEETDAARTDPLTGLRNKKYFYEIMPQIFERASVRPEDNPISIIMIDGDHFKSINDTYGHQIGDKILKELSQTIKSCVRTHDSLERSTGPGDYLIRIGGEEFVVIMEMTDSKRAVAVAERIREVVEAKTNWPGGIVKLTISLGVATYPADGKNPDDLMAKADNALYYIKEELGRNQVCHSQQVPRSYKGKKTAAKLTGELGVFDAAGLLQSIASSHKTGVLTIQASDNKQLWMLWDSGKPLQARMGKLASNAAITEFLVCFEDGSFNFLELPGGKDNNLPKLDTSFNVTRSLERCLLDGALAQDNYNAARSVVPTSEVYIRPLPQEEFSARWNALGQLEDPPSPEEFKAMTEIVKHANGTTTLTKIFEQLEPMPTHLLWRGLALMVQHGLVQTKPA